MQLDNEDAISYLNFSLTCSLPHFIPFASEYIGVVRLWLPFTLSVDMENSYINLSWVWIMSRGLLPRCRQSQVSFRLRVDREGDCQFSALHSMDASEETLNTKVGNASVESEGISAQSSSARATGPCSISTLVLDR